MKLVNQYIIPFTGLKEGQHNFNFEIGNEFFEEYSALEIISGKLNSELVLTKTRSLLSLHVNIIGNVDVLCDRCLGNYSHAVNWSGELYVKFKEEAEEPDDSIIYLKPSDDLLDLTQFFADSIGLSLPLQRFHPDTEDEKSGCDPKMLELLEAHTLSSNAPNNEEEDIDPRWGKLKDLLNDN